jgi:hypothetical protein
MLTTDISTSFEMKKQTVVAFLDVSGAYDDVLIDVSFELIFVQLTRISDTYAILVVSWLRRPARHSAFFFCCHKCGIVLSEALAVSGLDPDWWHIVATSGALQVI